MYRVYDSLGNFIKAFLHTNRQATTSLPLVTMVGQLRQLNSKDMKRVKTNFDSTKGKAIRVAINKELAAVHYINKVAVDVYGKIEYLTKDQVRALQIVAAKLANSDVQKFEEFKANVVVYSGRDITHSSHVVHWTNEGYLEEDFEKGFYSSDCDLFSALYDVLNK